MNISIETPPVINAPHIICDSTSYTLVSNGQKYTKDNFGKPLNGNALAQAIRVHGFALFSQFGEVIVETHGDQYRGMLYNGTNPNMTHTVTWGSNGPVRNVKIIGGEASRAAKIGGVGVFNHAGDLLIQNATIMNDAGAFAPFLVNQNGIAGYMQLFDINIEPKDPTAWQGNGMKWGIRGHGCARWNLQNVKFWKALEHNGYFDNCQGTSYFMSCLGGGTGRTMFQFTNRQESGPSAFGDLIVKGCESYNVGGQGGSDFTFAGIGPGTLWFFDNKSIGAPTGSHGSFVCWSDKGHGLYVNKNGFSTGGLIIRNFIVNHPNADRDHMAIAGVEKVVITNWNVTGNKTAIALNNKGTGNIDNGSVGLYVKGGVPPSQWSGWNSNVKMTKYNPQTDKKTILTNAQIDALAYDRDNG